MSNDLIVSGNVPNAGGEPASGAERAAYMLFASGHQISNRALAFFRNAGPVIVNAALKFLLRDRGVLARPVGKVLVDTCFGEGNRSFDGAGFFITRTSADTLGTISHHRKAASSFPRGARLRAVSLMFWPAPRAARISS